MSLPDAATIGATLPVLALLVFWAYCLVDLVNSDERDIRLFDKRAWLVIVVVLNIVGAVWWYAQGRPLKRR